jgi:hypothetical protein
MSKSDVSFGGFLVIGVEFCKWWTAINWRTVTGGGLTEEEKTALRIGGHRGKTCQELSNHGGKISETIHILKQFSVHVAGEVSPRVLLSIS